MKMNNYQEQALKTANIKPEHADFYYALGLAGEAGEVADKVKKIFRDKGGVFSDEDKLEIALELGDIRWYIANLAHHIGFTDDDIERMNLQKLLLRQKNGCLGGSGDHRGE